MDLKTVKLNCLFWGSGKMSLFPKKVEYPFKLNQVIVVGFRILCISSSC